MDSYTCEKYTISYNLVFLAYIIHVFNSWHFFFNLSLSVRFIFSTELIISHKNENFAKLEVHFLLCRPWRICLDRFDYSNGGVLGLVPKKRMIWLIRTLIVRYFNFKNSSSNIELLCHNLRRILGQTSQVKSGMTCSNHIYSLFWGFKISDSVIMIALAQNEILKVLRIS